MFKLCQVNASHSYSMSFLCYALLNFVFQRYFWDYLLLKSQDFGIFRNFLASSKQLQISQKFAQKIRESKL